MRLRGGKVKALDEEENGSSIDDIEMRDDDLLLPQTVGVTPVDTETKTHRHSKGLDGDKYNILLLLFLYVLQGIPLGLAGSMPMVLQNKGITYKQQAVFSFVFWPFSLKLLWAPFVDSVYVKSFGRRKTWLVPTQYLIGFFMLVLSWV